MTDLLVAEIFGPTFQGEGPSMGRNAAFLRLSRCNLACAWCDTPWTWDTSRYDLARESHRLGEKEILDRLLVVPTDLVVITGGEPLIQQDRLVWLIDMCRAHRREVEIETNGTVVPTRGLLAATRRFNVSPKLGNSGISGSRRINPDALVAFARSQKALFKFVVTDPGDLAEIAALEQAYGLSPIWVMAEGTSPTELLSRQRSIADAVLARGWNLSTRLQILLWGDVRGR